MLPLFPFATVHRIHHAAAVAHRQVRGGMKRVGLFLLVVVALAGCAGSSMRFMRNQPGAEPFVKRTEMNDIQVFINQQPNDLYDSLGFIEGSHYQPEFHNPGLADILPQLKMWTSAQGGDAFVVRNVVSGERRVSVVAEVIRYRT